MNNVTTKRYFITILLVTVSSAVPFLLMVGLRYANLKLHIINEGLAIIGSILAVVLWFSFAAALTAREKGRSLLWGIAGLGLGFLLPIILFLGYTEERRNQLNGGRVISENCKDGQLF